MGRYPPTAWYDALSVSERLALGLVRNCEADADMGQRLAEYWSAQAARGFKERLASLGVAREQLPGLLGAAPQVLAGRLRHVPPWMRLLLRAYGASLPEGLTGDGLECLVLPLVRFAHRHLGRCLRRFSPLSSEVLLEGLGAQLVRLIERVVVLQMHLAKQHGHLSGSTSAERWSHFVASLGQPTAVLNLLEKYPMLARRLAEEVRLWLAAALEFTTHLHGDWPALQELFSLGKTDTVIHLARLGDRHRSGRCTLVVTFASGLRLVYKPRSLSVDVHFQQVLQWLNRQGALHFRVLRILCQEDHGWIEYINFQSCRSRPQLRRFYRRMGGYLAVLYLLGGTDMFYENVIAAGEQPVLVDLEGLLQPLVAATDRHTVSRVGFLPCRVRSDDCAQTVDISALKAVPGRRLPKSRPEWQAPGSDRMRLVYRRSARVTAEHRPYLRGRPGKPDRHLGSLLAGFEDVYRRILTARKCWLAEEGLLACFAGDEVRVFCRPTWIYRKLLNESLVPWRMRHALLYAGWFDRLWAWPAPGTGGVRAIACECRELQRGDIPRFWARTDCCDLQIGATRIAGVFGLSGLQAARLRLLQMGEEDLRAQKLAIRQALGPKAKAGPRRDRQHSQQSK